jgi:uncharacterized protein Yka (UPF0111/DUF47 family)
VPLRRTRPDPELLTLFEESGRNVQRSALLLRDLLSDFPEQAGLARDILLCEQEGDRIVHDILHRLAERGSKRAHLDSADVHALAGALDDIVDYAEEAADQLSLYAVEAPMEQAQAMTEVLVAVAEQVATSLRGLRDGLDVGPQLVEIHRLENEGDRIQRAAIADLFAAGIDPMIVIRWKDIFETLEESVDACERVANVLEGITLKRGNGRH